MSAMHDQVRAVSRVFTALDTLVAAWNELAAEAKEAMVEAVRINGLREECTCGHARHEHALGGLSCDWPKCSCADYRRADVG